MSALIIALFTVKKALRERVYLLFLLITLVVIAAGGSVSFYNTGVQLKFLKDVSMLTLSGFGFLLCLFVATELIPFELETRGIHFLASKPVERIDFLAGKFLALIGLLLINWVPLVFEVFGLIWIYTGQADLLVLKGASLLFLELAVYGSMILFLSTVLTRIICFFGAIFAYVVAHLSDWITSDFLASSPSWLREGARLALACVPDLSHFDSRYVVVHSYDIPASFLLLLLAYSALYIAAFLLAARWVLESREL
jgi:ABC-type transport system involved in multi-copper enzyme maturation permease subunit